MGERTPTATFGAVMGVQAGVIALGRAAAPAITGRLHDRLRSYTVRMALVCGLLVAAAALVVLSGRLR